MGGALSPSLPIQMSDKEATMFLKKCTKCEKELPADNKHFRLKRINSKSNNKGLNSKCRECEREYSREYGRKHQVWKRKDIRKYKQEWGVANKDRVANSWYKRSFGITLDDVNAMADSQDQKCAICKTPIVWENKHSHNVDHRHGDGLVRGILCSKCNRGIGYFNDDPALFQSAITYLKSFNKVSFEVSEIPEESRGQTMATN